MSGRTTHAQVPIIAAQSCVRLFAAADCARPLTARDRQIRPMAVKPIATAADPSRP